MDETVTAPEMAPEEAPAETPAEAPEAPADLEGDYKGVVPAGGMVNGVVVDRDGHPTGPGSDRIGAGGVTLPTREHGGGEMVAELQPPADQQNQVGPALTTDRIKRLMGSSFAAHLAAFSGRPFDQWGLLGKGDTVRGHMILLDLESGEKVRAYDGAKIEEDRLFANTRNFPEALVTDAGLKALR